VIAALKMLTRSTSVSRHSGLQFLRGFLENPRQVASVIPSSPFLQRRLSDLPCFANAQAVVELGPGTGETTQAILRALPASAGLLCIELVPEFVHQLQRIFDDRLRVQQGDAADLPTFLEQHQMGAPQVVISGIPFSHLSEEQGRRLVRTIRSVLAPGGSFIAYQFRSHIRELADEFFGEPETLFVPWNIPPLDVYCWTKYEEAAPAVHQPQNQDVL
jgi:phosphatidylethanolamine/phosphatidyl-N-methylethanolamine N-methyltransferase